MVEADIVVDARYLFCPGPLLKLFDASRRTKPGQVIKLLATDPAAPKDVENWARSVGHKLVEVVEREGVYEIFVRIEQLKAEGAGPG